MPLYEYSCDRCKAEDGREKVFQVFKGLSQSGRKEPCPKCGRDGERVYSFSKSKEFTPFYDEKYGKIVTSTKQHEKLMKKKGEIYTADVPKTQRIKEQLKEYKFRKDRGLA